MYLLVTMDGDSAKLGKVASTGINPPLGVSKNYNTSVLVQRAQPIVQLLILLIIRCLNKLL